MSLPNEAQFLIDWTRSSTVSYAEFLQTKEFEHSIRYAIDSQTKILVATNKDLADRGITVVSEDLNRGFTLLSENISEIKNAVIAGTEEVTSTLFWGFSEVLVSLGKMNDSLDRLISLAKTPSQTWAYEQFEIARDEFRRGLYAEALDSVSRAIHGHGSNTGHRTEYRFQFLLGNIRLGSLQNRSSEVVDLSEAEKAFLSAARYADNGSTDEAGRAMICAARSALLQNRIDEAVRYSIQGLKLNGRIAEGHYQLARLYCIQGRHAEAIECLIAAFRLEPGLSVAAAGMPEFIKDNKEVLINAINKSKALFKQEYENNLAGFRARLDQMKKTDHFDVKASDVLKDRIGQFEAMTLEIEAAGAAGTLLGFERGIRMLNKGTEILKETAQDYRRRFTEVKEPLIVEGDLQKITDERVKEKFSKYPFWVRHGWLIILAVFAVSFVIFVLIKRSQFLSSRNQSYDEFFLEMIIAGAIWLVSVFVLGFIINNLGEFIVESSREAIRLQMERQNKTVKHELETMEKMEDPLA